MFNNQALTSALESNIFCSRKIARGDNKITIFKNRAVNTTRSVIYLAQEQHVTTPIHSPIIQLQHMENLAYVI